MGKIGTCGKACGKMGGNKGTSGIKPPDHMIYGFDREIGGKPWKNQVNPLVNHHIPWQPGGLEGLLRGFGFENCRTHVGGQCEFKTKFKNYCQFIQSECLRNINLIS